MKQAKTLKNEELKLVLAYVVVRRHFMLPSGASSRRGATDPFFIAFEALKALAERSETGTPKP